MSADLPLNLGDTERLSLFAGILEHSSQGVMVTDDSGHIVMVNAAFTRITGYGAHEAIGQTADLLTRGQADASMSTLVHHTMHHLGLWLGEVTGRRKNGESYPLSVSISTSHDTAGQALHAFTIFSDVSSQQTQESRLQRLANFDSVTGLPNRMLLQQLLEQQIHATRRSLVSGAVLVVQLHRLGWVYDTLGHEVGDTFISQVAQRIKYNLREQDILARLGHDKLAVVLPHVGKPEHAAMVAQKLLSLLRLSHQVQGHDLLCVPSVGIAMFPDNGQDSAVLLRNAEIANQLAPASRDAAPSFFHADMQQRADERLRLEVELRQALHQGQLVLYHQPKVNLRNGRIVGAEALLRWNHPRHGLLAPNHFIPLAEESSLISDVGDWVLNEACRQLRDWQTRGLNMPPMAINLSARQFTHDLPQRIDDLLTLYGVPAQALKLEITESLMMHGADEVIPIMNQLAGLGLGIALDDFGTGYSSLSYLKKFPLTTLKIDRAFVEGIPLQSKDRAIAQAIVTMGKQLRLEIVAEGVETQEQMAFLRQLGCDQLQGHLFSQALTPQAYERLVLKGARLSLSAAPQ